MKKQILPLILSALAFSAMAQTAKDFTVNDCNGSSRSLFKELNDGKVIVLCWVMPCGSCVIPSLTTYNVVKSFQSSNPGKVIMYMMDDYANTDCVSLKSWASENDMGDVITISNAAIKMTDYGTNGMPKIVVVGGHGRKVFYNANYSVNSTALQNSINSALAVAVAPEIEPASSLINLLPNPASTNFHLSLELTRPMEMSVDLLNSEGKTVLNVLTGPLNSGDNQLSVEVTDFPSGLYFLRMTDPSGTRYIKVAVLH